MSSMSALGDSVQSLATNSGRVQPTSSPEFVLDGFGHKFADWILNDYWMVSLRQVATSSGGIEPIGLFEYCLVKLSTTISEIGSEYQL